MPRRIKLKGSKTLSWKKRMASAVFASKFCTLKKDVLELLKMKPVALFVLELQLLCDSEDPAKKMFCKSHVNSPEEGFVSLKMLYPGDLAPEKKNLHHRERSVLSPIKLMSQITRKSTLTHGRIGYFEAKGPMYTTHNYEFAEMAYGGTLSLFFVRGDPAMIRKINVEDAYKAIQATHPLLSRYDLPGLTFSLVNYHVSENKRHVDIDKGWLNNALFANEDVNPQASDVEFKDLIIGEDNVGKMIRCSHPSLKALLFPYLYTTCTGHYSMVPQNLPEFSHRSGIYRLPENQGGVSVATMMS